MVAAKAGQLLPGPLCDVLDEKLRACSEIELGRRVGVSERQIQRWRRPSGCESGLVTIRHADKVLTALGLTLDRVYGAFFAPERTASERHGGKCKRCGEPMRTRAPMCGFCRDELGLIRGEL